MYICIYIYTYVIHCVSFWAVLYTHSIYNIQEQFFEHGGFTKHGEDGQTPFHGSYGWFLWIDSPSFPPRGQFRVRLDVTLSTHVWWVWSILGCAYFYWISALFITISYRCSRFWRAFCEPQLFASEVCEDLPKSLPKYKSLHQSGKPWVFAASGVVAPTLPNVYIYIPSGNLT